MISGPYEEFQSQTQCDPTSGNGNSESGIANHTACYIGCYSNWARRPRTPRSDVIMMQLII